MKTPWIGFSLAVLAILFLLTYSYSSRADERQSFKARLTVFQEVPPKLTNAHGTFRARINGNSVEVVLTYSDLSSDVLFSHIHFGQSRVNGGIFVFLCNNVLGPLPPNPVPAGVLAPPTCPTPSGTVTRTFTAADIFPTVPDQGIRAQNFADALRAIRSGETYANVHSKNFPGGEIRGQIGADDEEDRN